MQLKGTVPTEHAQTPGGYAGLGEDEGRAGSQADGQTVYERKERRKRGRMRGKKFCVKQTMLINLYFLWSLWAYE